MDQNVFFRSLKSWICEKGENTKKREHQNKKRRRKTQYLWVFCAVYRILSYIHSDERWWDSPLCVCVCVTSKVAPGHTHKNWRFFILDKKSLCEICDPHASLSDRRRLKIWFYQFLFIFLSFCSPHLFFCFKLNFSGWIIAEWQLTIMKKN